MGVVPWSRAPSPGPRSCGRCCSRASPASAAQFVLTAPQGVKHGVAFSLTLTVQDAYGNWVQVSGATSITPAVITTAGVYTGNVSTGDLLAFNGRLRWTVTGTTPVFPGVSFNIYGR